MGAPRRGGPRGLVPAADLLLLNVSEIRGPGDAVWAPRSSDELDYELEIGALIDTPARDLTPDRAEEAIGGYTIFNDWSARDLQRDETAVRLGPAKGKDFASSFGPWLVTPDELEDARQGRGFDLAMTASVNGMETSRGRWSDARPRPRRYRGPCLCRRAAAPRRPDRLGDGRNGLPPRVRDATLGRYLQPGDEVTLEVERLGQLRTPVVARPG